MIKRTTAECAIGTNAEIAESPVWDPRVNLLVWADIATGVVWRSDVDAGHSELYALHQRVGCVALYARRGYLIAGGTRISVMESFGQDLHQIATAHEDRRLKLNDGAVDPQGQFWVGSSAIGDDVDIGALYCLDSDGCLHKMLSDITTSNGMDWSPDGRTFYYVDTAKRGVDAYEVNTDSLTISNRRRLIDVSVDLGLADGLTVDADGCIWLAIWYAGEVHRYSPTGTLLEVVSVPAKLTTSCTFGGRDLRTLFITTAKGLPRPGNGIGELAGSIFAVETTTNGRESTVYGQLPV